MVDLPLDGQAREVGDKALAQRVGAEGDDRAPVLVGLELEAHVHRAERAIGQEPQQEPAAGLVAQPVPEARSPLEDGELLVDALPRQRGIGELDPERLEEIVDVVGQVGRLRVGDDLEEAGPARVVGRRPGLRRDAQARRERLRRGGGGAPRDRLGAPASGLLLGHLELHVPALREADHGEHDERDLHRDDQQRDRAEHVGAQARAAEQRLGGGEAMVVAVKPAGAVEPEAGDDGDDQQQDGQRGGDRQEPAGPAQDVERPGRGRRPTR